MKAVGAGIVPGPGQLVTAGGEAARRRAQAALAVLAILVVSLPVLLVRMPPLIDYHGHLAGVAIQQALVQGGFLAEHYVRDSWLVPNLLFDGVVLGLTKLVPLETAGRLFIVLTFALLIGGTILLHRALFGRASLWPLAAAPFVYNYVLLFGFMSYLAGIGLALVALAGWLRLAERPVALRLLYGVAAALLLFFTHIMALVVYAAALAGVELHRSVPMLRRDPLAAVTRLAVGAAPFLPALLLFLAASPTSGLTRGSISYDIDHKLVAPLLVPTTGTLIGDVATVGIVAAVAMLGAFALRWRVARPLLPGLGLMALIYVLLPDQVGPSGFLATRMASALPFLLVAMIDVRPRHAGGARLVAVLLAGLVIARMASVAVQWVDFDRKLAGYRQAVANLPAGATLLIAREGLPEREASADGQTSWHLPTPTWLVAELRGILVTRLYHLRLVIPAQLAALATLRGAVFVPQVFATPGIQPIRVADRYVPIKRFQGDYAIVVTSADGLNAVAAEAARLQAEVAPDHPAFLMLQSTGTVRFPAPPGTRLVAEGYGFRLLALDDGQAIRDERPEARTETR